MIIFPPAIIGGALPALTYIDADYNSGSAATTRTVSGLSFGPAGPRRYIVATIAINSNESVTAVTIGGVSASIVSTATANLTRVAIAIALVLTGTSGNVSVTASGSYTRAEVGIYAVTNLASATPHDTASASSPLSATTSLSLNVDVPANGVVVGIVYQGHVGGGSAGNESWSGLTENYLINPASNRSSGASGSTTAAQTPRSVSVSNLTSNAGRSGAAASFR